MNKIIENLHQIKNQIPENVKLIVVSKNQTVDDISALYNAGNRIFGENRVQELVEKQQIFPKDIEWHLIGHLQTNKVKYIAPFVSYIHSIDSLKLLEEVDKQAAKNNRIIKCLLKFHIAKEETKFGLNIKEAYSILQTDQYQSFKNIQIVGIMGMATYTNNEKIIIEEFKSLKEIFNDLKQNKFEATNEFKEISMGMSSDYIIAIQQGATMIRVGSAIFNS